MARRTADFQTIRSEGGLCHRPASPPARSERKARGYQPEDYGLSKDERLNEVITQSWRRLSKHWAEFRTAAAKPPRG